MSDLLPPGNMPAPNADGDDVKDFPDFFASNMWPSLWPRIIHRYATTAARDADLAGLGSADRAFAYVDAIDAMTKWNGTAWRRTSPLTLVFGVTLDADGYATVIHTLGYTPTAVVCSPKSPIGSSLASTLFSACMTDTFTSTTFQLRGLHADGTACVGAVLVTGFIS